MAKFDQAVPVLQVNDVSASMRWYSEILGFEGRTFPNAPPYSFALLSRDGVELMFQRRMEPLTTASRRNDWAVYIRLQGGDLAEFQTIATNIPP